MRHASEINEDLYAKTDELKWDYPVEFLTNSGEIFQVSDVVVDHVRRRVFLKEA